MHLLVNADVFAPEALGPRCLLVAGERVVWIGKDEPDLPAGLSLERRDLAGRRVIPGLIDGHVHVLGGGGESGFASRVPPLVASDIWCGGTTTVVGLLGTDDVTRTTAGLLAHTRALRADGLSAFCLTGGYHLPPTTLTGSVQGDIVHLDPVIGVGEVAISDHRSSQPTLDEILRIASEAHVAGMIADKAGTLHLHVGRGDQGLDLVRRALDASEIPARVFHPTHVNRRDVLFEEALDLARRGVTIDVSAFPPFPPGKAGDRLDGIQAVAAFLESDVPAHRLTLSSDGGGSRPLFSDEGEVVASGVAQPAALGETLAGLVAHGVPLERALEPFTSNVARQLRLPRKGRIRVDGDADLVVLDDAGRACDVMARGRWQT